VSGKHGPNRLDRYLAIHDAAMGRYREQGFIEGGDIDIRDLGNGEILMSGEILCSNRTRIDVTKTLRILDGSGASAIVQTVDYSYCAVLSGVGNVFRYCAPHGADDGVPHHPHHHVHRFDVFAGDERGTVTLIDEEKDRPTLGEVIDELRGWCADNAAALSARNG
jgi:hypothetical protein